MNGFLDFMTESGALLFGYFLLKSGRKSPYFVNAGEYYKTGKQLDKLGKFYAELIRQSGRTDFNVLFGPAYKGIPLAVLTAAALSESGGADLKVTFNRKEAKDHGEGGSLIGYTPRDGDRIAIIEDVTSAGTSVRETTALLKELGIDAEIVALYISVDRLERGTGELSAIEQLKQDFGISVYSIANAKDIIGYLENPACSVPDAAKHAEKMREYLSQYGVKQ
jgi:orotate phosphoribosyltransferase